MFWDDYAMNQLFEFECLNAFDFKHRYKEKEGAKLMEY